MDEIHLIDHVHNPPVNNTKTKFDQHYAKIAKKNVGNSIKREENMK